MSEQTSPARVRLFDTTGNCMYEVVVTARQQGAVITLDGFTVEMDIDCSFACGTVSISDFELYSFDLRYHVGPGTTLQVLPIELTLLPGIAPASTTYLMPPAPPRVVSTKRALSLGGV